MKFQNLVILSLLSVFVIGCTQNQQNSNNQEGISEIKSIPQSIENNCIGFVVGGPSETGLINEIGGAWARPHPGPFAWGWIEISKDNFDFSQTDEWVEESQKNNVTILATIWPYADWDQSGCHSTECEVSSQDTFYPSNKGGRKEGIPMSRCSPCSFDDYKSFLSRLVERYDGDGFDDMPGLEIPIKYWEVLNEPEMDSPQLTFFKGTEEEYVNILKESNEAIKATCSDCKVVQGGCAGTQENMLDYWDKVFDLGGADYIDITNIHFIKFGDVDSLNVAGFKELLDSKGITKPIWVTEAEYSYDEQIAASVIGAFDAGADKIFFTQFKVGQYGTPINGGYSDAYNEVAKCV